MSEENPKFVVERYGTAGVVLNEGFYTRTEIQQILSNFDRLDQMLEKSIKVSSDEGILKKKKKRKNKS